MMWAVTSTPRIHTLRQTTQRGTSHTALHMAQGGRLPVVAPAIVGCFRGALNSESAGSLKCGKLSRFEDVSRGVSEPPVDCELFTAPSLLLVSLFTARLIEGEQATQCGWHTWLLTLVLIGY